MSRFDLRVIAHIESDFPEKFGIPRQSGLVPTLTSRIVFEPEFRDPNSLRGIEEWSHLWLIWEFSEVVDARKRRDEWSPTVRPPRLGGNERVGVFATRSPFRPNPLGLSSVKLEAIEQTGDRGLVLVVSGADLMDGTPIYDIKPYLAFTDSHPEASGSFAAENFARSLSVDFPEPLLARLPEEKRRSALDMLAQDPRPAYKNDSERIYGVTFAGFEIKFKVDGELLTVVDVM